MTNLQPPLFHATLQQLSAGQVVAASRPTDYYPDVVALLEANRPSDVPSRSVCLFASDSAVASTAFLLGQKAALAAIRLYRVEMNVYHKAPFRLIRELDARLTEGKPVKAAVDEYWTPRRNWAFWEYFGPTFTVVEEAPSVNEIATYGFKIKYDNDIDLSRSL